MRAICGAILVLGASVLAAAVRIAERLPPSPGADDKIVSVVLGFGAVGLGILGLALLLVGLIRDGKGPR
jgi:hypothetical protein